MRVRWTTPALRDYAAAGEWLAARDPVAAERVFRRIDDALAALSEHPRLGRPGRVAGTRELVVPGTPYTVVYRAGTEEIAIVAFLHGRRQWPERL